MSPGEAAGAWLSAARRGGGSLAFCRGGARHDLHGGGLGDGDHLALVLGADGHGLGLGLFDHVIGFGLGEDAALHEFVDEVDRDIAGRGVGGIGTRAEWRRCWGGSGLVVGLGLGGEGLDSLRFLHGDFWFPLWRDDGKRCAFGGSLGLCRSRSGCRCWSRSGFFLCHGGRDALGLLHRDLGFFFCLGDWQRRAIFCRGGGGRWRGCWSGLGGGVFEDELFF